MSTAPIDNECDQSERVHLHALRALAPTDAAGVEAHLESCARCREELEAIRPVIEAFVAWPTDVLRPRVPLWDRVAEHIAAETGDEPLPAQPREWDEPEWKAAAPGISCKVLSTDWELRRVSMLVRLAPRTDYPPHRHAGVEELHLLDGVLIVDDKILHPGDYLRSDIGTSDARIFTETGCTCVLVTSIDDELR